ncbi:MAG TPA: zinc dependent phospholipase C family protein [Bdellovibrionota bacterium]|nr:zinc dependent phospholipase C family protein [Bdellovibrionota bacterium]
MTLLLSMVTILVILLLPDQALAWGPATHLIYANAVLDNLSLLAPPLQQLLLAYKDDFLYGNIAADITLGKKYIEYEHHCHNWRVGFEILNKAKTELLRSFAYGYLTHLAADAVSHNYFVPFKTTESFRRSVVHRHAYWEVRFDAAVAERRIWKNAIQLAKKRYHKECDAHLDKILHHTLFTFRTNRRIFHGLLVFQNLIGYQNTIKRTHDNSKAGLEKKEVSEFYDLSLRAIHNFLTEGSEAAICRIDPSGEEKLKQAAILRRELRRLLRTKSPLDLDQRVLEFREELKDQFSDLS